MTIHNTETICQLYISAGVKFIFAFSVTLTQDGWLMAAFLKALFIGDGRIPKDLLYGELATGTRSRGRPKLRFRDVCKRDMKAFNINTETWEASADDRTTWKQLVSQGLDSGEKAVRATNDGARAKREARQKACTTTQQSTVFACQFCSRRCSARIGLFSHSKCCSSSKPQYTIP